MKGDFSRETFSIHSCWPDSGMNLSKSTMISLLSVSNMSVLLPVVYVSEWLENKLVLTKFNDLFTQELG